MTQSEILRDPGGLAVTAHRKRRFDQPHRKYLSSPSQPCSDHCPASPPPPPPQSRAWHLRCLKWVLRDLLPLSPASPPRQPPVYLAVIYPYLRIPSNPTPELQMSEMSHSSPAPCPPTQGCLPSSTLALPVWVEEGSSGGETVSP